MQNPRAFNIDPALLNTGSEPSDRFVYSTQYVRLDPDDPDLKHARPAYQIANIARFAAIMPTASRQQALKLYPRILELAQEYAHQLRSFEGGAVRDLNSAAKELDHEALRLNALLSQFDTEPNSREAIAASIRQILSLTTKLSPRPIFGAVVYDPAGEVVTDPSIVPDAEQIAMMFESEIGFLFLDRTRIRPVGFAIGEHVMALSLAPGEEIVLEQRTFSKRESTYEDLTDQEETMDLEMSSTLTSELTDGLDREQSRTTRNTNSMGARVSGEIYGVNVEVGPSSSRNVDDANRETTRTSVKNSRVASSKIASRYRSQHKVTFRVSTETRFETTSRRTFRNPNTYTPIDLQYFKILQRLQLTQERFGIRLCWSPAIRNPAANILQRLDAIKKEIYAQVDNATSGPQPTPPVPPSTSSLKPQTVSSTVNADEWDWVWGNQRHDYTVDISAPSGYVWDGVESSIKNSIDFNFTGKRPAHAEVVKAGGHGTGVRAIVHVGIEDCRNPLKSDFWEPQGTASFTISADFIPRSVAGSNTYDDELQLYMKAMDVWRVNEANAKAQAKRDADEKWELVKAEALSKTNPLHEAMAVMVKHMFPSQYRDNIAEIDLWERLFDFSNASLKLYPSWWIDEATRDPKASPTDFVNASWARLYLPIRPGSESLAMKWIFGATLTGQLSAPIEKLIQTVIDQITKYRTDNFGDDREVPIVPGAADECPASQEEFICLAQWRELMPTDGTHLEVMQATTLAADDDAVARMKDADDLRKQQIAQVTGENALRQAAAAGGLGAVSTEIKFHVGEDNKT